MPTSSATRSSKDAPTRFDLYALETAMVQAVESVGCSVDDLSKNLDVVGTEASNLGDKVDELRKSVDALTKAIEKLPEQLPCGKGE